MPFAVVPLVKGAYLQPFSPWFSECFSFLSLLQSSPTDGSFHYIIGEVEESLIKNNFKNIVLMELNEQTVNLSIQNCKNKRKCA